MNRFGIELIDEAQRMLASSKVETPLLNSPMLDRLVGATVYVKAECLQATASFKLRGALFKMMSLSQGERERGVITYSAGNHGQAVSAAAKSLGCNAVIIMPFDAPKIKIESCRWWGAEIVLYDKHTQDREEIAKALILQRNLTMIPPFDDLHVMAGQGTVGLEIAHALKKLDKVPDSLILGSSGGGLASGCTAAMLHHFENVKFFLTEALGYTKWQASLGSGKPEKLSVLGKTIMDGIAGPGVGCEPFEYLKDKDPQCLAASDLDASIAMCAAFRYLKIVVEPGGAAALGALIREKARFSGQTVVVICSGGNVDPEVFSQAMTDGWAGSSIFNECREELTSKI